MFHCDKTMANLGYNKKFRWVLLKTDIPPQNMATQNFSVLAMDFHRFHTQLTTWLTHSVACGLPSLFRKTWDTGESARRLWKKKNYRYSNFNGGITSKIPIPYYIIILEMERSLQKSDNRGVFLLETADHWALLAIVGTSHKLPILCILIQVEGQSWFR